MPYSRLSSDISAVLPINIGPSFLYVIASYIIPSYNIASYNVIRQAAHTKGAVHHRTWTVPENASRSGAKNWAVVSAKHAIRKARPVLSGNSGTQFPLEGCSGKRVPFRAAIPGHGFLRYKTTIPRLYHMPSNIRSRNTKQQIECSFSKSTRLETYPVFITRYRSRSPITAHRFGCKNVAENRPSTCMVRFWSAFGQLSGKFQLIRFCYPKGGGSS